MLGRVAVVGSGNMSESSASTLVEAALITDDARAVVGVRTLVDQLAEGGDLVDKGFIARILKIKVRRARGGSRRRRSVRVRGPRAWLMSVVPIDEHEDENELVESEKKQAKKDTEFGDSDAGYVRWTGSDLFRKHAKPGDLVIEIWRPHSKSKRGTVYAPEPLLRRKDKDKVTHLFIEAYSDRDATSIPFSSFSKLWQQVGAGRAPALRSVREMPVELAETLRQVWKK